MMIRNDGHALTVAVEMERRAIRVYERALLMTGTPEVVDRLREILSDERRHLTRFEEMRRQTGAGENIGAEDTMTAAAMAGDVLFPGGVMEMLRTDALRDVPSLMRFAADNEREAVRVYTEFALNSDSAAVREAFLDIADEESGHLAVLEAQEGGQT